MGSKKVIWLILSVVVAGGAFLRFYRLADAPPSVNWDEASYGYNAYSLWKTGRDEYGEILPWTIRSFDDYKPPLYAYMTAPIVGIGGLTEYNTRLMSAIFGSLASLIAYAVTLRLTKRRPVAVITAAIMATTPALSHYSRLAFEAVPALTLMLISLYYLTKAEKNNKYFIPALLFMVLSYFSYNSHKVYLLLEGLWIGWRLKSQLRSEKKLIAALAIICLPIAWSLVNGHTLARFSTTSVFSLYPQSKSVYEFGGELVNRYLSYFSVANIFVRGTNEPNQRVREMAVFFPFFGIFYLIGAGKVLAYRRRHGSLMYWWLTAPLPAAITWSWFTPIRVLPLWWATAVIIAIGITTAGEKIHNQLTKYVLATAGIGWWIVNTFWLAAALFWYMPYTEYGLWQWGFRETIKAIEPIGDRYQKIVWESPHAQPYIFVLFYKKYDPAKYQAMLPPEYKIPIPGMKRDFDKYTFRKIYWPTDRATDSGTMFIGGVYSLPEKDIKDNWYIDKDVIDPAGYTSFRIVRTKE